MKLSIKKNKGSASIYRRQDGFTLIELLVVISLMALLSFIVLASLDNARAKGRDSQMQSLFASLRAKSEQYYTKYNMYGQVTDGFNLCYAPKDIGFGGVSGPGLIKDIVDVTGVSEVNLLPEVGGAYNKITCHSWTDDNVDGWAVEAPLSDSTDPSNGGTAHMYCVDSTGVTIINNSNLQEGGRLNPTSGLSCNW